MKSDTHSSEDESRADQSKISYCRFEKWQEWLDIPELDEDIL